MTLRLYPQPEAASAATCTFPTIDAAVRTVIQTIQLGVPIARCELLDALTIQAVNAHSKLGLREAPMLFCEFHGSAASVKEQAETVQAIAREQGGMDFEWATQQEDRTRLWQARHDAYPACLRLKPGGRAMSTDVCVPISRLAECIAATNKDLQGATIPIPVVEKIYTATWMAIGWVALEVSASWLRVWFDARARRRAVTPPAAPPPAP